MLDILMFGIYDLWFDSTATSILLVYLTDWALGELRSSRGQVRLCVLFMSYIVFLILHDFSYCAELHEQENPGR